MTTNSGYEFNAQRWALSDKVAGVASLVVLISLFLLKPSTYGIQGVSIGWSVGAFLALIAAIVAVAALTPAGRQRLDSRPAPAGQQPAAGRDDHLERRPVPPQP